VKTGMDSAAAADLLWQSSENILHWTKKS
jgi:hypothetical protein